MGPLSQRQYFRFGEDDVWDITTALEFVGRRPPDGRFRPEQMRPFFEQFIEVEEEHVPDADLSVPLIGTVLKDADGTPFLLLIDGWHRLARALREGASELRVYLLTPEEEAACRIVGTPGRMHDVRMIPSKGGG